MEFIIAGLVGLLTLGLGFAGAYLGGVAGWFAIERSWFETVLSRQQWIVACIVLGFLSGLSGGLFGAELAAGQFLPSDLG